MSAIGPRTYCQPVLMAELLDHCYKNEIGEICYCSLVKNSERNWERESPCFFCFLIIIIFIGTSIIIHSFFVIHFRDSLFLKVFLFKNDLVGVNGGKCTWIHFYKLLTVYHVLHVFAYFL